MTQGTESSVTDRGLRQQGYVGCSAEDLQRLKWGLRFTPSVCMAGCVVGMALQNPPIHFVLAGLGMVALVLPAHHPLDLLYNYVVRLLTGGPKLPPNPLPRRVACFLGGAMNLGIAICFIQSQPILAYAIGVMLVVLQIIVISSHFCVASWLIEIMGKMIGASGPARIDPDEARQLIEAGAVLVDVRSPQEFGSGHLPNAVNVPVDELADRIDEIRGYAQPVIVYCASGMRSNRAAGILRGAEVADVHDLGSKSRW